MRRILYSLVLFLAAPTICFGGPISWLKAHPKTTKLLAAGISAGVYAEGLHECRLHGVENCDAHYGAAWATYGVTVGLDLLAIPISEKIGGKAGAAISFGGSAAMLGWGIYQWRGGLNKHENEKVNLSSVELVGR